MSFEALDCPLILRCSLRRSWLGLATSCLTAASSWLRAAEVAPIKDYPTSAAPLKSVHVQDEFWLPRLELNRTVTLWHVIKQAQEHGEFDNFAKAAGTMPIGDGFRGSSPARDSDAYKIIEGIAYTLAQHPDPKLEEFCDGLIANIAGAQEADGYLYTARRITPSDKMPEMAGPERFKREKIGRAHV